MDYKTTILTKASKENSFAALTVEIDKWWGKIDNIIFKKDDEFSIFFDETEWRFKVIEYTPTDKVIWKCIKANHIHGNLKDIKEEWLNTSVIWEISEKNGNTIISLLHKGLTPELNCYDVCNSGWNYFVCDSLKQYLDTGSGKPYNV